MKSLLLGVGGVLLGVAYVLASGAIAYRILADDAGAQVDLRLALDGLVSPQVPVGLLLVLAMVSAGVLGVLFWSIQITSGRAADSEARPGIHDDLSGWIELGGSNHAVFVVAVLAVGVLWVRLGGERYAARTST